MPTDTFTANAGMSREAEDLGRRMTPQNEGDDDG